MIGSGTLPKPELAYDQAGWTVGRLEHSHRLSLNRPLISRRNLGHLAGRYLSPVGPCVNQQLYIAVLIRRVLL
jgi:hypothetical protein